MRTKQQLKTFLMACAAVSALGYPAFILAAQGQDMSPMANQQPQQAQMVNGEPLYKITVVGRDIPAINYFHRSGATHVGLEGTSLLPQAKGSAKVDSERGRIAIDAKFEGLVPANSFGPEYLTYVLWAITPQGRPQNLGEVLPDGSKGSIGVTTDLQSFGLIVTAEPYFAVTIPSDVVVMQNFIEKDKTSGIIDTVNAHFQLLPRGAYAQVAGQHAVLNPITRNERSPLELYEAENAVRIAAANGAEKYSPDIFSRAQQQLSNAEGFDTHKSDRKQEITYARGAVQDAEDARLVSIRKMQADDIAAQQKAAADATAQSQQQAEQARLAAQQAATQQAQAEAQAADARARAAEAQAAQQAAQQQAKQAVDQTQQMREKLRAQLNSVLQTQETARGLIVNMSDVLFDTGKFTLKPDAKEKLAKVSGILLAYPDLKLQVEGYTDNVGGEDYNMKLSQERADAVSAYLTANGVQQPNVTAEGYGMADPVADNSTASGRAENRRVQLVVSGAAIGVQQSAPVQGASNTMPTGNSGPSQ
jgi:outer membrane protein OmpA-like peptidoglycan-associated protein